MYARHQGAGAFWTVPAAVLLERQRSGWGAGTLSPAFGGLNTGMECLHSSHLRIWALPEALILLPEGHMPKMNCPALPPKWPNRKEKPLALNETR